jgi:hypothetical protein
MSVKNEDGVMAESGNMPPLQLDLIMHGRVVGRPVTFVGTMEGGKLTQICGSATLNVSLSSILADLKADYGEATKVLKQLVGSGDIVLEKLGAAYRSGDSKSVQVGLIIKFAGSSIQYALLKGMGEPKGFIVGLDLRSDKLALPKNFLSGLIGDISIGNLGVYYASEEFKEISFFGADAFQDTLTLKIPQVTGRKFSKGVNFSAEILVGGVNLLDQLEKIQKKKPPNAGQESMPQPGPNEAAKAKVILDKGPTRWIEANKTIGPLSVRRIGLSYADQKIGIKFDAGLQLSCLTFSLLGMGITYPITQLTTDSAKIWENLEFQLDGAGVAFEQGPLTISGGLLKVPVEHPDTDLQLDGALLIRTELFTIAALGSYANMDGTHSVFVFAALQKLLGGPPIFVLTGLAFGFGVNRALKLPAIDEVQNFPLVKAATVRNYLGPQMDLRQISQKLGDCIYPSPSNFWIAAGVKFMTYGMLDSFALLSVSLGTQFEIAVLGLSRLRIPKELPSGPKIPAIACAELALKAAFKPMAGILSAEARLTTNSFLFTKDCALTGGFAFYVWFGKNEHAGDFVITLGGYHPRFKPPPHYPDVPRLGVRWQVSSNLRISGGIYFALTPTCLMAGGALSALYQQGRLRAWFDAYAHFFMSWKPLHYDIEVGVRIGASYTGSVFGVSITFRLEMAAMCHFWGPPFAGKAHITWTIISFTIYFGEERSKPKPKPIDWDEFQLAFLPPANPNSSKTEPLTITIVRGLIKEGKTEDDQGYTIVNPHQLALIIKSNVPSRKFKVNGKSNKIEISDDNPPNSLGIRPMNIKFLDSSTTVSITNKERLTICLKDQAQDHSNLQVESIANTVPGALWSPEEFDPKKESHEPELIKDVLSGVKIESVEPELDKKKLLYIPDLAGMYVECSSPTFKWVYAYAKTAQAYDPDLVRDHIQKADSTVIARRSEILQNLEQSGIFESQPGIVAEATEAAGNMELDVLPLECGLGMLPQYPKD